MNSKYLQWRWSGGRQDDINADIKISMGKRAARRREQVILELQTAESVEEIEELREELDGLSTDAISYHGQF